MIREYIYVVLNIETWHLETFTDLKGVVDRVPSIPYRTLLKEDKGEIFRYIKYPYRIWKVKHHKSKRGGKGFG
jgi:hypothetical protein